MKFSTTAIHAGYHSDPTTRAAAVPVYQTTSYTFDDSQHGADLFNLAVPGNIYTRMMNPTHAVLEARVAALEGGVGALALASGMSAIAYALQVLCSPGSNIVSTSQLYGGTYNLFAHSLPNQGVTCRFVAMMIWPGWRQPSTTTPARSFASRSAIRPATWSIWPPGRRWPSGMACR